MEYVIHTADDSYYLLVRTSKNYIISPVPTEFLVVLGAATPDKKKLAGGFANPHDYIDMQLYIELDSTRVVETPIVVEDLPLSDPVQLSERFTDRVTQPITTNDEDEYLLEVHHHFSRFFIRMGNYKGTRVVMFGGKPWFLTNILVDGSNRSYRPIVNPQQMVNHQIVFQNGTELFVLPVVRKVHHIARPRHAGKIRMKTDLAKAA